MLYFEQHDTYIGKVMLTCYIILTVLLLIREQGNNYSYITILFPNINPLIFNPLGEALTHKGSFNHFLTSPNLKSLR